ncbi:MAG: CBS domain-containing protein [Bacteroidales bacterium]|nr:CBS domain-containing protein [Bacteroidales bacterium]
MNSDDFLDYYNRIDLFLKKSGNHDPETSFSQKVKKSSNAVVKRFKDDLLSFGELRNAIVHNPKIDGRAIAEPHIEIVTKIKELYEFITNPKKVTPRFQFEVFGANENDYINDILIAMRERSYSQIPVFNEKNEVIEVVNSNTISRWLSTQLEGNGTIITENVKIKDLISEVEFPKNYRFISRNTSIFEAFDFFTNQINSKQRNLDVLLITNSGKQSEGLLGLVTIEDIATEVK